jgi:four helix bundle protein
VQEVKWESRVKNKESRKTRCRRTSLPVFASIMNQQLPKIKSFTDIIAWQEGHKLVLMVYQKTKQFPKDEIFGITSQMRRCAVSITSNIAEGFSRQSSKEKVQFYFVSLGSLTELQNQALIARDIDYISKEEFKVIADKTVEVHKILNGLIKSSRRIA